MVNQSEMKISENSLKGLVVFIVLALIGLLWWCLSGLPMLTACLLGLLVIIISYINAEGSTYWHGTNEVRRTCPTLAQSL